MPKVMSVRLRIIKKNAALENHNLIIFTPKDNPMIRKLNDQLYFHYDKDFTRFVSNEKLSIEKIMVNKSVRRS